MRQNDAGTKATRLERVVSRIGTLIEREQIERALWALDKATFLNPSITDLPRLRIMQMECYLIARRFDEVAALLGSTRALPMSPREALVADFIEAHSLALSGRAREALRRIVPLLKRHREKDELWARGYRIIGLCCYRTGHYGWARHYLQDAAAYYRLARRRIELIRSLTSLSLIAKSEGRVDLAMSLLEEGISLLPKWGNTKTRLRLQLNRGVCLLKLGKIEEARAALLHADSLASLPMDTFLLVSVCNNLGHVYRIEGNLQVAKEYHERALTLAKNANSVRQECLSLEFLGETSTEAGDSEAALAQLDSAFAIAVNLSRSGDLMMEVLRRRGEALALENNIDAATLDLERAQAMCRARGERRELILTQRALALLGRGDSVELSAQVKRILESLHQTGDHFEYAKTVYLVVADGRLQIPRHDWLEDAVAVATHYFLSLGSKFWLERLRGHLGHVRRLNTQLWPSKRTTSSHASEAYKQTLAAAAVAARGELPVLILGETGAGKELVARTIHSSSSRASAPLVAVNCGAIPESLVESEFFGHVQGAYTGASREKAGLFEAAHKGTVLLDEIGDLPLAAQVKLLRFLDSGEVRRVGETHSRSVKVRVLASTNRDLNTLVKERQFREDLLFRLNAFVVEVPPLRSRREDIVPMAEEFLRSSLAGQSAPPMTESLIQWMLQYSWPGNIRELRNLCGYLSARCVGSTHIDVADLPTGHQALSTSSPSETISFDLERRQFERDVLKRALQEAGGNLTNAARLLGMGRNTVAQRMRTYGWTRKQFTGNRAD